MKRVHRSNEPSISQLERMSYNLCEVFGKYSNVIIESLTFSHSRSTTTAYIIYVADTVKHKSFSSWPSCQDFYFNLIKEASK